MQTLNIFLQRFGLSFYLVFILFLGGCGGEGGGGGNTSPPPISGNVAPVAANDVAATRMNMALNINVLANDTDPDGDTLSVASVTQGMRGAVSINQNGTVNYSPATNFTGRDKFSYTIKDGYGNTATASVTVKVALANGLPIERVSVSTNTTEGNQASWMGAVSSEGGYIAFHTSASNLISGGSSSGNILLHDRVTNETSLVSVDLNGLPALQGGQQPAVSSDGRYVAFSSFDSNLIAADSNASPDIFVRDRQLGTTTRVSIATGGAQANGGSFAPAISADGRYVTFFSLASNLVPTDLNGANGDIFVHDRESGETNLVSIGLGGTQIGGGAFDSGPSISYDGRYVAFMSNGQIFVRDRQTNQTTMASVSSTGTPANGSCNLPAISGNGQVVAYTSVATNLVTGDTNGVRDIFVHDLQTGVTIRVDVATDGTEANGEVPDLNRPAVSEDGRFIAFLSAATNLVAGDTNGVPDVFVHDRQTNQTIRINAAGNGDQANGPSGDSVMVSMTANGEYVVLSSQATNLVLGDTNGWMDVFVSPNPLAP
ncbi:MAG TPA: cadherin-like domain-containing protein [Gallionellaceae bacterium]